MVIKLGRYIVPLILFLLLSVFTQLAPINRSDAQDTVPDLTRSEVVQILASTPQEQVVRLRGVRLTDLDLSWLSFRNVNLDYADLRRSSFVGADLAEASLEMAILEDADLTGAFLARSSFVRAFLARSVVQQAQLGQTDLKNADLTDADLSNSSLVNADLRWAKLVNTNLRSTDLTGADIRNAYIDNVILSSGTTLPNGDSYQVGTEVDWSALGAITPSD